MTRLLDLAVALVGILLLSPLLAVIAVAVRLDSAGPALHRAIRVGRSSELFHLCKFRTMVVGAERLGPGITTAGDARITKVGRLLRKSKLDELPQLFNVLRGEMSLVGPRPEDPRYVAQYTAEQRRVLDVRPGITSPASLEYRHEETLLEGPDWERRYLDEIVPRKLAIDLDYLRRRSWWSDLGILVRTAIAVFR